MLKPFYLLRALLLGGFAVFALGFSHLSIGPSSMPAMDGMSGHAGSSVRCQILCTTAIKPENQGLLTRLEREIRNRSTFFGVLTESSLSLLAVRFIVKRLHLLTSWRPPDLILLYGHHADGL